MSSTPGPDCFIDYVRTACEAASERSWRSYDPFDLLLCPLGEGTRRRSQLAARLIVQFGRRSGSTLRSRVGMKPREEAKVFADFLSANVRLASAFEEDWSRHILLPLVDRLERLAIHTPSGPGWGLSFPYASRFVSVPARTPNAYTTISSVSALASAGAYLGDDRVLGMARAGARTITDHLGVVRDGRRAWLRYWPDDDACIVNVHALIAAAFGELARILDDNRLMSYAELAASIPVEAQREDGSFPYALDARGQFVDAFHTGFVLEGLKRFQAVIKDTAISSPGDVVERGMEFLRDRLVSPAHLPRSSPDGAEVTDGQNVGQLIQTLVVCGGRPDRALAVSAWGQWTQHPGQRASPVMSLRWDVGPPVLAAAHLAAALADTPKQSRTANSDGS